jgi:hypothetical protein
LGKAVDVQERWQSSKVAAQATMPTEQQRAATLQTRPRLEGQPQRIDDGVGDDAWLPGGAAAGLQLPPTVGRKHGATAKFSETVVKNEERMEL